ncbi:hypothetical protein P8452_25773 [Trifolium repens]|nr:hypothetical protein QL285_061395 [Trifolium repens]WJX38077.1 hypothetical protein P8452_25773 [Trifolium repens]
MQSAACVTAAGPSSDALKHAAAKFCCPCIAFSVVNHKHESPRLADNESKKIWRKLMGSMRTMHLQRNQSLLYILNGQNNMKMIIILMIIVRMNLIVYASTFH